ncbi:MAG: hypothetical protein ABIY37_03575 [Devosia sp.]
MMLRALATFAFIAAIPPALSADPHLGGMAEEVLGSEWAAPTYVGNQWATIGFAAVPDLPAFDPDRVAFATVIAAFGGEPVSEELFENSPLLWLCYDTGGKRTTFVSLGTILELPDAPPAISLIVEEVVAEQSPDCDDNPAAASPQAIPDLPGVGASLSDLEDHFGEAPVDSGGHLAYVSNTQMSGSVEGVATKIVYYRIESGTITGVGFLQRFEPNA